MAALIKNAILVTGRNKNKKYFPKFKILEKKIKMADLNKSSYRGNSQRQSKTDENLGS